MTDTIETQKARKKAKLDAEIVLASAAALLRDLKSKDDAVRGRALKIHSDHALERIEVLKAENAVLKVAVGNTADLDAAVAAKNTAEAELETVKQEWSATIGAEVRKVQDTVRDGRAALSSREVAITKRETVMKNSTDAALTLRAFDFLSNLVRRMKSWEPEESQFFDPDIPKSPYIWRTWWDEEEARLWCAWETELSAMPREKQIGTIAHEIHVRCCINHQNEKVDLSPERMLFLQARLKHMGPEVEQSVFDIGRTKTEVCRLQPHPMPARHVDYDFAHRTNLRQRILTGDVPQGPELPEWLA
jgi:hypothetical protein